MGCSGGSTPTKGLDYRFDLTRSQFNSFVDDVNAKITHLSSQLDYRVTSDFKVWGAVEYKEDKDRTYWGTPLVSAGFPGISPLAIVSGSSTNQNGDFMGPVTVDSRTYKTNYNVLDNHVTANELWLRGGFEWRPSQDIRVKSQIYGYHADRDWFDSETYTFNPATGMVDRDRFLDRKSVV